ncbi:hypothetical protein BHE90_012749 [Fusarium euwallaceae]|uniref:GH18 domain-containing protein n=1 Tax=Fusarium euwallaceae TaxID=1147111 RepID=A0A430LAZ0_9HYPO|nr:hypothetical protein BHE90_012749 [Fusarium euwallaceae]
MFVSKNWDFNGIDIDWKPPDNEDGAASMVLLLEDMGAELYTVSSDDHLGLSIVALGELEHPDKLPEVTGNLDRIDLMACDCAEPWSFEARRGSNPNPSVEDLDSRQLDIDETVHAYPEAEAAMEKLTLGWKQ